jgi:hypothetical protein
LLAPNFADNTLPAGAPRELPDRWQPRGWGPPRQSLSPVLTRMENGMSMQPSWDCGMRFTLQLPMIISPREDLTPPRPFHSSKPSRLGTKIERNLKTRFCRPQAEMSASESGRKWVSTAPSCTIYRFNVYSGGQRLKYLHERRNGDSGFRRQNLQRDVRFQTLASQTG